MLRIEGWDGEGHGVVGCGLWVVGWGGVFVCFLGNRGGLSWGVPLGSDFRQWELLVGID